MIVHQNSFYCRRGSSERFSEILKSAWESCKQGSRLPRESKSYTPHLSRIFKAKKTDPSPAIRSEAKTQEGSETKDPAANGFLKLPGSFNVGDSKPNEAHTSFTFNFNVGVNQSEETKNAKSGSEP